ncbi:type VI secretion system lipoprotein TssJ [Paraburkholderia sp. BL10I2N1]|uniref:type VI secretion system lipoprotein TssJ n=1 Tax=Paraburkholderia sp. BL10I2N1 TaxID=1938796 RepID=UPI001060FA8D|nr:type VI secretion system lipoprotein TssJ [Paraburkholderia sp. BL10I2N1]
MKRWPCRASLAIVASVALLTTGCGVMQAVTDGMANLAKSDPARHAKAMTVDLTAQAFLNPAPGGQSLSVVVRFYQLRDVKTFADLTYVQLQRDDQNLLKADLLGTKDVVLRPDASASIVEPMNEATRVVGVVAFFRAPLQDKVWKLAIPKKQWKNTDPVKIEVSGNELVLVGENPQPVKHEAPQQAAPAAPSPASVPAPQSGTHKQG